MKTRHLTGRRWRPLLLLPVTAVAILSIIATGGGGDDGDGFDDGGDDGPVNILPTYNFFLANLPNNDLLTVTIGNALAATIDIDGLFPSTIDLDVAADGSVTLLAYSARDGARFDLTVSTLGGSPLDGTVAVIVLQDIAGVIGDAPGSGEFEILGGGDTVTVTITLTGVAISLNGEAPIDYSWEEFDDLFLDDTAEPWQRVASLAHGALQFMYESFFTVADTLDDLELIALNSPVSQACDMFTGSPPAGVLAQGETTITWLGSGELMSGDDFDWQFNQCWFDDPNDTNDQLIDGSILMEEYTETIDMGTNTLFEIGFGGLGGQPGGVNFDLTIAETVEDSGVFTIPPETVIDVNGGFAMIIQQP